MCNVIIVKCELDHKWAKYDGSKLQKLKFDMPLSLDYLVKILVKINHKFHRLYMLFPLRWVKNKKIKILEKIEKSKKIKGEKNTKFEGSCWFTLGSPFNLG